MAQIAKMEVQVELKSSADKFYDVLRNKLHLMPKICPQECNEAKLVAGDWNSVGSVRMWSYTVSGEVETVKETTVAIDDQSKTMVFNMLEGEVMKYYKTFKSTFHVSPSGHEGSLVNWTIEFEKQNESIPDPVKYKDLLTNFSKHVDAYLLINA